uniref:Major facilitator superfamily (MFS) profile domain-containing protein n=2 Tax=Micromonas pusilla TaxID=38833 RepID=A0A6U2BE34_MICPS|mmetsp:Transcript_12440/g.48363  ORF Transcript_12440/g.48363 Transcript_12440/m.48363 type:complete len:535 (+) Transcript_12440:86-1690(+)
MIVAQISDIRPKRTGTKFGQAPVLRLRTPLIVKAADKPARPSLINPPYRSKFRLRTRLRASCPRVILSMQRRQVLADAASLPMQTFETESGGYTKSFLLVRMTVFLSILLGYACYYLTRNSLTFTAPAMVASPALGLDITSIGVITSIFPLCYGCSKFVSGVVGDVLSPSIMLGGGLMATGLVNVAFGASSTLPVFCFLWAGNGILQGFGAPSCAKILTSWFAAKERGTYWGMWNIAHNLGGFAAPILAGTAARTLGWNWGLWAPGIIALSVGLLIILTLKDSPEARGFSPVEHLEAPETDLQKTIEGAAPEAPPERNISLLDNLFQNVLSNPFIWGLAFTYFCVYVVRQGITSWSVFYLIKEKGVLDAGAAAVRVSGMELGGLLGSLIAGRISDWYIATSPGGAVGKRIQVVMAYLIGVAAMLAAFKAVPSGLPILQAIIVFMIGFFLYGPQMLIGLCGAEIVGRRSVGASEGFLGWIAYLGAANAGVPLSLLVQQYGWNAFFAALLLACAAAIVLLAPITGAQSHVQRSMNQ